MKRARFLSAALDQRMLKHSQYYKDIKDSYVIFITENDVFKAGLPLYHIERSQVELKNYFNDGNHIVYANAAYSDTSNDIGKLMHDFRCRNSEDMYYKELREGVYHFKETEGGRAQVSKDIEKYGDMRAEAAEKSGKITGAIDLAKSMNMKESEIEDYLIKKFNITREEATKYLDKVYA